MMAANHGKRRCQKTGANPPPRSLLFELHISVGACWWEGSEGLLHPLLIQHLQWLSTLSLLAPISLPQLSATIHRPQTVLYPFDSQSQSAAEVNKHDRTSRGQAGHLEAVVLARASGSNARAGPWVTLLSLQMAGDRDFVPLPVTWWSGTRKREALDMELCTNSRQLSRSQAEPYLPPITSRRMLLLC